MAILKDLIVQGTTKLLSALNIGGNLAINGNTTVGGNLAVVGSTSIGSATLSNSEFTVSSDNSKQPCFEINKLTKINGIVSTRSVHGSPLVVDTTQTGTAAPNKPYIEWQVGSYPNGTPVGQLLCYSNGTIGGLVSTRGEIHGTKYNNVTTGTSLSVSEFDGYSYIQGAGTVNLPVLPNSGYQSGRRIIINATTGPITVAAKIKSFSSVYDRTFIIPFAHGAEFMHGLDGWTKIGGECECILNTTAAYTLGTGDVYTAILVNNSSHQITLPQGVNFSGRKIRVINNTGTAMQNIVIATVKYNSSTTTSNVGIINGGYQDFYNYGGYWFYSTSPI